MKTISWKEFREMWNKGTVQKLYYEIVSNRGHDITVCLVTWKNSYKYSYHIFGGKIEDLIKAKMDSDVVILYHSGRVSKSMVKLKGLKVNIWD